MRSAGPTAPTPDRSVPGGLVPLARRLQTTAQTLLDSRDQPGCPGRLDRQLDPGVRGARSGGRRDRRRSPSTRRRSPRRRSHRGPDLPRSAQGRVAQPVPPGAVAAAATGPRNRARRVDPTDAVTTSSGVAHTTAAHHPAHLRLRTPGPRPAAHQRRAGLEPVRRHLVPGRKRIRWGDPALGSHPAADAAARSRRASSLPSLGTRRRPTCWPAKQSGSSARRAGKATVEGSRSSASAKARTTSRPLGHPGMGRR